MSDINSVDNEPDLTGHVEGSNRTIEKLANKDQPNDETIDENEKYEKQEEKNNAKEDKEEKIELGEQLTRNISDTGGPEMQISNDGTLEETINRKECSKEESDAKTAYDSPMPSCSKTTDDEIIKEEKQGFSKQSEEKTQDNVNSNIDKDVEKEDKSRISLAFESTRKFIAWVTVGKIGPGFLIAPILFSLVIHVMMFVLGIQFSNNCTAKPLVPVSMVLLGGGGLFKSLSYLLQVGIVIQTKMRRAKAMMFLSESSILDNGLNSLYVCTVFIGAAGVFVGEMDSCHVVIFEMMYYYTVISLCILGLVLILLLWKLIKPNIDDDFIDERGDII